MGHAKYVGRVGVLAVALGIGAAVATTPGIAFADEPGTADPGVGANENPNPDPGPNPDLTKDSSPKPDPESNPQPEGGQNNAAQQDDPKVRKARPGEVLSTGGFQQVVRGLIRHALSVPETTPPTGQEHQTPPPAGQSNDPVAPLASQEPQKSRTKPLPQNPVDNVRTALKEHLPQINRNSDPQLQRATNQDKKLGTLDNTTMTALSSAQDQTSQTPDVADAASPPTVRTIVTGLLSVVGLGPSTGATPRLPFVPAPIFDAVFAVFRRIEHAFTQAIANQTPTATVSSAQDAEGEVTGQVEGADKDGDALTYAVGTGPEHGDVTLDPETGDFVYTPDSPAPDGAAWQADQFTVVVSDDTNPHLHLFSSTAHTYEVTVKVPGPQPTPPPPPPGSTTVTGQITGVTNPSGGPVDYAVQTPAGSTEHLDVDQDGTYTYTPTTPLAHGAAVDEDGDGQPDNPVFQKFTVVATDQDGNETTIELNLPVTPTNTAPVPNPDAEIPPQPTPSGGFSGQIPVNPDADGDQVKIINAVASDGTPVSFDGLNWTYGASSLRSAAPQGFVPQAAMMSFASLDEGSSDDAQVSTLAAGDPVTITFTLSDGHGGVVPYTVSLPAADEAPVDVSAPGGPQGPAIVDASRDRAYQISYVKSADDVPSQQQFSGTTYVTVIDTQTGEAIGDPIAMPGVINRSTVPAAFSGDTSHVFLQSKYYDPATGSATTYVAAIDAETGELVDNDQGAASDDKLLRLPIDSNNYSNGRLLVHGNRIYAVTVAPDPATGTPSTHLAILNADTGELLATPITVTGENMSGDDIVFGGNDRAYLVRHDWTADSTADQTYVAVVNTATGQLVGSQPVSTNGQPTGNLVIDDSTGRAYLTTIRNTSSGGKTWITVIDTEDGQPVNTPVERDGLGIHSVVLSKNGDRAYQLLQTGDFSSPADSSQTIAVINTTTGAADGADVDVDVPGGSGGDLVLDHNANGNEHAYVSTLTPDYQHTTITVIDTQTRTVVDRVADINGAPPRPPVLSGNGKTVYQVIDGTDGSGAMVTRVAVFDTATGTAIGAQPIEVMGGQADEVQEIGDRLYVQTTAHNVNDPDDFADDTDTSRVAVINTQTGQLMGAPLQTDGITAGDIVVNGDRAYQRTVDETRQITRITVLDTTTGQRVGASPIEIDGTIPDDFSPSPYSPSETAPLVFGDNDRAYQVTQVDNNDGTYTVRVAVINTDTGALLNAKPIDIEQTASTKVLQVADDGRVYLTVYSAADASNPYTDRFVTLAVLDADTGEIIGDPLTKDGIGFLVNGPDGQPRYLLSVTPDFSSGFGGAKDVTFTPLAGGDPITVPGSGVAYATSPDGSLAYVVTDGTDDSTITVVDLEHGEIVATSSTVPGHAGVAITPPYTIEGQGGLVFGADGKGYLTTYIKNADGTYSTQVTGLPGLEPTSSLMSFGAMNVIYPGEDTNPPLPQEFSSNGSDPGTFDMNSLLSV
jgi:hypothetical protein